MSIPLPPQNSVAVLLGQLIDRNVTAKAAPAPKAPITQAVAAYLGECQSLLAVACCDLSVGGSLGAALTMIPPDRVNECVKAGRLDDFLAENLYEVFNVLSAVFPKHGAPRVFLREVHRAAELPDDVRAVLAKPARRLDLEVAVPGYRSGLLSILAA
jgi:hypothetical protein